MRIMDWSSDVCSSDPIGAEGEPRKRHISAVALALDRNLRRIDEAGIDEHPLGRNDVVEIGIAMLVIVEMIEGPARPLAAAIVDLEHHIAEIGRALCGDRVGQYG